jgi:TPR repeat protein
VRHSRWCSITVVFTCLFVHAVSASESNVSPLTADEWPKLLRQAQHGNHKAQIRVAFAFQTGEVVKQDFSEARKWFLKAAEAGHPIAEHHLGVMFYSGMGGERSPVEALKWFERAAAAGLAEAQFNAALMCESGSGIAKTSAKHLSCMDRQRRTGTLVPRIISAKCMRTEKVFLAILKRR